MKIEVVLGDRPNSCKRKGNVLSSCVTPTYMNELEGRDATTLTEKQEEKVQVCETVHECTRDDGTNIETRLRFEEEKKPGRRIVGVKRADKRRMDELRVEVGVKEHFQKKLASCVTWAGHARGKDGRYKTLAREQMLKKREGKRGQEDHNCDGGLLKRDIEREGEEWRKYATDRRNWRLLVENVESEK